ncbi:type II toxin-antitoxin system Y4mF family antitoxin [Arthrobacter sp. NPDC056493]|uniref:type II toxin-antitoxin system Y4mF family antitoxin n=1 Tax=Arthrobacter sp. NPDC056493 TaxID=3345839 RepID=UPI00366E863E
MAVAVRARRTALRLSQQDLADMAGVSERLVRFVEQGKPSLRLDTLVALLDTLGLELQLATRTSAAARALVTQALVTQPLSERPPSDVPLEGSARSEREAQP